MRTLDSRLNEVERVLNEGNTEGLPCLMYVTNVTDDEQAVKQAKLKAYEEYKARNITDYPQLGNMDLANFEKSENVTIHINLTNYARERDV
jgi:hypothetical protein